MAEKHIYYLLLGGNLPNTLNCFDLSIDLLSEVGDLVNKSKIYKSKAWGYESKNEFKNQALEFTSILNPSELLLETQKIEKKLGRKLRYAENYEDRVIDIDILFCGDTIIESENLVIPHPLLHKRMFALEPLSEIAPNFIHTILLKTIKELLKDLGKHNKQSD